MITNHDPVFDAALALPLKLRDDLAAILIESVDKEIGVPDDLTSDQWARLVMERSDAFHRGETTPIDGEVIAAKLQAIVDRTSARP